MKNLLFYVPFFEYEVKNWSEKKNDLWNLIDKNKFEYVGEANFQTDKNTDCDYGEDFENIFKEELVNFLFEIERSYVRVKNVWTLKYTKPNEGHRPHNHSSTGYTGIVYLEHDPEVHSPTTFISPWNDPITDTTPLIQIQNPREGVIYIWPSNLLHYVDGMKTDKRRVITSWDMEVK